MPYGSVNNFGFYLLLVLILIDKVVWISQIKEILRNS